MIESNSSVTENDSTMSQGNYVQRIYKGTSSTLKYFKPIELFKYTTKHFLSKSLYCLESYVKLVESFKENKLSELAEDVSKRILQFLHSDYASSLIKPYFKNATFESLPFTGFETEPDNVSQIKKLINALHNGRLAFLDLETIDLRTVDSINQNVWHLATHTVDRAYDASVLITHLDVNLKEIFHQEFTFFQIGQKKPGHSDASKVKDPTNSNAPADAHQQNVSQANAQETEKKPESIPLQIGKFSGKALDQMRPLNDNIDFDFLTKFSEDLPKHISIFAEKIEQWIPRLTKDTAESILKDINLSNLNIKNTLNPEKLDQLYIASHSLQQRIEELQNTHSLISLKFLNYIAIIRHVITLSQSILEQMEKLSSSSQNLIIKQISQLKYEAILPLFNFVDKVEINMLLNPGILSRPLKESIKKLYDAIIYLPAKAFDFNLNNNDLLIIEDSRFIQLRINQRYLQIEESQQHLFKTKKAEEALEEFIKILQTPVLRECCIHQLPKEVKQQLIIHYHSLEHYFIQFDVDFNSMLVTNLLKEPTWTTPVLDKAQSYFMTASDKVSIILETLPKLKLLIEKSLNTHNFYINQNKKFINYILSHPHERILPLSISPKIPVTNEYRILSIHATALFFSDLRHAVIPTSLLQQLPETIGITIKGYYQLIQPVITVADESIAHALHVYFERFNNPSAPIQNDALIIKDILNIQNQIEKILHDPMHPFFTTPVVLDMDQDKMLSFKLTEMGVVIDHASSLHSSQAINLWSWYQRQQDFYLKLELSCNEIYKLIKSGIWEKQTLNQGQILYRFIQPFLVQAFDNSVIDSQFALFLNNPHGGINIANFLPKLDFLINEIQYKLLFINEKKQFFEKIAHNNLHIELQNKQLELSLLLNNRAHNLLKDNFLSAEVNDLRLKFLNHFKLFNISMRGQLHFDFDQLPFPEMKQFSTQLRECDQVKAIKALTNCLYHLYQIALDLEKLKKENSHVSKYKKIKFLYDRLTGLYDHLNEIKILGLNLLKDPYAQILFQELYRRYAYFCIHLQNHTHFYTVAPEQVYPEQETIKYGSMWYVLNAFYIIPNHIRLLKNNHFLTKKELVLLERQAKKANFTIESLINNSSSYVKIFFLSPKLFLLYRELKQKLNEFTTTIHDLSLYNLEKINRAIFLPMIIEADSWEDKAGLKPGSISQPVTHIIHEYFNGLLAGIEELSSKHFALLFDNSILDERMRRTNTSIEHVETELTKLDDEYQPLLVFAEAVKQFYPIENYYCIDNPDLIQRLKQAYKNTLPLLNTLKNNSSLFPSFLAKNQTVAIADASNPQSTAVFSLNTLLDKAQGYNTLQNTPIISIELDQICNDALEEHEPHLVNIESMTKTCLDYYYGLKATKDMALKTHYEKKDYLQSLHTPSDKINYLTLMQTSLTQQKEYFTSLQTKPLEITPYLNSLQVEINVHHELTHTAIDDKELFISQYCEEAFQNDLARLLEQSFGLNNGKVKKEFRGKLKDYLLSFKESIIKDSAHSENAKVAIKSHLEQKLLLFKEQHLETYHQFDNIVSHLKRLRTYSNSDNKNIDSVFENTKTLTEKHKLSLELLVIAQQSTSITDRLISLTETISSPRSKYIMNGRRTYQSWSFDYLKYLILRLLQFLKIRTPEASKINSLLKEECVNSNILTEKLGLFSKNNAPSSKNTVNHSTSLAPGAA